MRAAAGLLLAIVAGPAWGQDNFNCGAFKTETKRTGSSTAWTIMRGNERSTESAVLKSGPRFECISGEVLAVEFTTAANTFVGLYFPDGNEIGYGGQIVRRNNRFVLPIQAKPRAPPSTITAASTCRATRSPRRAAPTACSSLGQRSIGKSACRICKNQRFLPAMLACAPVTGAMTA